MQDIVIAGVGSTKFGKLENLSATELATTAALQAIDERKQSNNHKTLKSKFDNPRFQCSHEG